MGSEGLNGNSRKSWLQAVLRTVGHVTLLVALQLIQARLRPKDRKE